MSFLAFLLRYSGWSEPAPAIKRPLYRAQTKNLLLIHRSFVGGFLLETVLWQIASPLRAAPAAEIIMTNPR